MLAAAAASSSAEAVRVLLESGLVEVDSAGKASSVLCSAQLECLFQTSTRSFVNALLLRTASPRCWWPRSRATPRLRLNSLHIRRMQRSQTTRAIARFTWLQARATWRWPASCWSTAARWMLPAWCAAPADMHARRTRFCEEHKLKLQPLQLSMTPLLLACSGGHAAIARALLEKGADVEARGQLGSAPLHWAAEHAHLDTVRLLLDKGAQVEATDKARAACLTALLRAPVLSTSNRSSGWQHAPHRGCAEGPRGRGAAAS